MKKNVVPVPAATILLVRDNSETSELEVFMVVRHHQIDFASGALVFPGGKTSVGDQDPRLRDLCDGADALDDMQLALAVSAIREAFEESGVLLARPVGDSGYVSPSRLEPLEGCRKLLDRGELAMVDFLEEHELRLALDALVPFAHWITPDFMPKRFDTHFYVAIAPSDQIAVHDGGEAVDSVWLNPNRAIEEADEGKWTIIFPTRLNVDKLGRSASAVAAIETARSSSIVTVLPQVIKRGDQAYLQIPEEAGYCVSETTLDSIGG
ncbi:MAG: NUDIX hydrolase [Alphaproteobacteria bacterium]|nr:MAG: NUDIX hydrolase [Alphaproteobacteria bacterium]